MHGTSMLLWVAKDLKELRYGEKPYFEVIMVRRE